MLLAAPLISTPLSLLPRSFRPVLSEPIRLPTSRLPVDAGAQDRHSDLVARDHLRSRRVSLDRVGRGVVDPDSLDGVAESVHARAVGADQVVDDEDLGRVAGMSLGRRCRSRAGSRRSRCPGRWCCSVSRARRLRGCCPAPVCRRLSGRSCCSHGVARRRRGMPVSGRGRARDVDAGPVVRGDDVA